MKFTLTGRHFEITPYLKSRINEKVKKFEHVSDNIIEVEIVLFKDSVNHVAEGKLHLGHTMLAAKGLGKDMYIAVNDLVAKLLLQIKRHEGKLRDRKRQPRPD